MWSISLVAGEWRDSRDRRGSSSVEWHESRMKVVAVNRVEAASKSSSVA